jgi:hypothetical protein
MGELISLKMNATPYQVREICIAISSFSLAHYADIVDQLVEFVKAFACTSSLHELKISKS